MCRHSCHDNDYFPDRGNEEIYFPEGDRVRVDSERYPYYLSIPFWTEEDEDEGGCGHHHNCGCHHHCHCHHNGNHNCRPNGCGNGCNNGGWGNGCGGRYPYDYWRCCRCGYINYHRVRCSCPECRCGD